mmetsp:Transcript_51401/g.135588  ORF Transcript_51401/g.135588 Transcript_51401/m.135588 type:complete len:313 (-) Transcript_51401:1032-1970(-)
MVVVRQPHPVGYFDALDVPGLRFPLPLGDFEIGRDGFWEKHPCLRRVSRRHALVEVQLSAAGPRVFVQDLGSTHGTRMRCGDFFRPFRFYLLAHGQDVALADLWLRLAMSEVALPGCHTIRRPSGRSADRRAAGDGGETDGSVCDGEGTTETLSTQVDGSDADSPAQRLKESGSKAAICCKVEPNAQATSDVAGQSYLPTGRTATSVGHAELGVKSENGYVDGARVQKRVRKRGVLELSDSDVEAQGKLCAQACNCKDELGDGGSAPCQIAVSASLPPLDSHECCSPRSSCHQPDCKVWRSGCNSSGFLFTC